MARIEFTPQLRRFTDTPTLDSGAGTLREALDEAFRNIRACAATFSTTRATCASADARCGAPQTARSFKHGIRPPVHSCTGQTARRPG